MTVSPSGHPRSEGGVFTDLKLADGEVVVRRYRCAVRGRCATIGGIVIPKRSSGEDATVTVTDRRIVCHAGEGENISYHQEMRLSDVSSLSGLISKFGRRSRIPLVLAIIGVLIMAVPYMYAVGTDVADKSGDYVDGYNDSILFHNYIAYLSAVSAGTIENTIPIGYEVSIAEDPSEKYMEGWNDAKPVIMERITADLTAKKAFSEPKDLLLNDAVVPLVKAGAIIGAVLIVLGTFLYVMSYRTRDWVSIRIGGVGDPGILVSSAMPLGNSPMTESGNTREMITDLGAVILTIRAGNTADLLTSMREVD